MAVTTPQPQKIKLRPITRNDNAAVATVIRTVMPEFGADGPGFAFCDAEVDAMWEAYGGNEPRAAYFVVELDGTVIGGAGVAPLIGDDSGHVCELRKMYILKSARGLGVGRLLMEACLQKARALGFHTVYLETLDNMHGAKRLYEKCGFKLITGPRGNTGHGGCDVFMELPLK